MHHKIKFVKARYNKSFSYVGTINTLLYRELYVYAHHKNNIKLAFIFKNLGMDSYIKFMSHLVNL